MAPLPKAVRRPVAAADPTSNIRCTTHENRPRPCTRKSRKPYFPLPASAPDSCQPPRPARKRCYRWSTSHWSSMPSRKPWRQALQKW